MITGFGCDTSAVINILAHRDAAQRALIQQEYRTMYSEDLSHRISSELSGHLMVQKNYYVDPNKLYLIFYNQGRLALPQIACLVVASSFFFRVCYYLFAAYYVNVSVTLS